MANVFGNDLTEILRLIAAKLDLDETRHQNAVEKYQAVAKWLGASNSSLVTYNPDMYPQGSFALGTVTKPLAFDEYDLDFVCELTDYQGSPEKIKGIVGERLKESTIYQSRLEEMSRCWRLNYAGKFHMDILPARPATSDILSGTAIEVPDRELGDWSNSDPKGYVAWFQSQMVEQFTLQKQLLLEQRSVDYVPDYAVKTTLQQSIQLLKRNRDIEFENDGDDKPISIIITTLAAQVYSNQSDLFDTLTGLVSLMPDKIETRDGVPWVMNPVNSKENFAEKWEQHHQSFLKFKIWLDDLKISLQKIQSCDEITEIEALLSSLFGEKITTTVLEEFSEIGKSPEYATIKSPPLVHVQGNKPWSK